jgi:tetratricopeptide (TPR) repeat protein
MDRTKPGQKVTAPAITFLSDIEKGKRSISPPTVGKLIHALDLPESWLTRFLTDAPDEADEETPKDREAEGLIRRAEADPEAPETPEPLLILLAEEWSGQKFTEPSLAYNALKSALQAAADMRAQGALPSNISAQFQAVMRRVAALNDAGQMDEADAALRDARERNEAESEALFEAELKQDRLRNRPAEAAKRLIARLRASAPASGLFWAVSRLIHETHERGEQQGDPFDLHLALELAEVNRSRANGQQLHAALTDLGICHFALGERQASGGHLTRARNAYADALRLTSRQRDPQNWAVSQENLGNALLRLGERTADPALLKQAIAAHRAAQTVFTPEATPMDWATSQNNLGNALQTLGERTADPAILEQAVAAHRAALTVHTPEATSMDWATSQNNLGYSLRWLATVTRNAALMDEAAAAYAAAQTKRTRDDAPFYWAQTQWNLADLALARHALAPDPAHLATAQAHLDLAREVFAQEGNDHQLAECDRLQSLIDAA